MAGLLDPGELVADRYEIRYLLGEGPTGVTYRALDHEVEIEIALKMIDAALLPDAEGRDRFVKGMTRLIHVSHPNVVKCFEVGVHGGRAFLALQLCEGLSLRKLFGLRREKGQAFTLGDLEPIVQQVARGLGAVHKRGIVAGALRPEGIIVLPDAVKVADPAVWRHLPHAQLEVVIAATDSARYLAPEVKKGAVADPRTDSYSLAVLVQEMLGAGAEVPPPLGDVLAQAQQEKPAARPSVERLAEEVSAIARTGKRAPAKASPARSFGMVGAPKTEKIEAPTERTSRISEEELAVALEPNRETTRQVHEDELLALRARTSGDTQQIRTDELMPVAEEDHAQEELLLPATGRLQTAFSGAPLKPAGADPSAGFDDMKTIPVERIGPPELATEPASPAPVARMAPPPIPPSEADDLTPLPPPVEPFTPPRGTPLSPSPPPMPSLPPALPRQPPPRANGAIAAAQPPHTTVRVAPPPMPVVPAFGSAIGRMGSGLTPAGVVKLVAFCVAATALALVVLWMRQTQHAEQERRAKEKAIERLREREARPPTQAAAGKPAATPLALPEEGSSDGCPLGAKRNHAEGHDFCIDAYEFPGGHIVPRTGIAWAEAEKLCESRGERLCTRREWVASCLGPGGASYPYGNTHDVTRCNVDGQPQAAGSFPHCKSFLGTFDMVGNVSEWVAEKMILGGSALRRDARTRCDTSQKIDPNLGYSDVGFRCCTGAK